MDMSFDAKALGELFALSREAAAGIEDNTIRFANDAAKKLLGAEEGMAADSVFPPELLSDPAERFSASLDRDGRAILVHAARRDGLLLLICETPDAPSPLPARYTNALAEFGSSLSTAQRAARALLSEEPSARPPEDTAAMLYRSFYRLRRLLRG